MAVEASDKVIQDVAEVHQNGFTLQLENFRSFKGAHEIPIADFTFLVGENSTGKTSLLAALAAVTSNSFPSIGVLAREPYKLGGFRSMCSDGAESFVLGRQVLPTDEGSITAEFQTVEHRTVLTNLVLKINQTSKIRASYSFSSKLYNLVLDFDDQNGEPCLFSFEGSTSLPQDMEVQGYVYSFVVPIIRSDQANSLLAKVAVQGVLTFLQNWNPEILRSVSIAPTRTKSLRTYDGNGGDATPEGDHIPYILRSLAKEESLEAKDLQQGLADFGHSSGLFDELVVDDLASASSDAFQLMVSKDGKTRNLADVGYGVSQVLPILADCLLAPNESLLLVQQPEVHLHPRGQAELGSFFKRLHESKNLRFVVETHSDYLIDRMRLEVKRGLNPEKVLILYLTTSDEGTKVNQIYIDKLGNFVDAPDSFRSFFLREQAEILGF